jgi:hypothetical protein
VFTPLTGCHCKFGQTLKIEELQLLRKEVLGQLDKPTEIPMAGTPYVGGVLALDTPPLRANQSEVRVSFALPNKPVTFGVRVMASVDAAACAGMISRFGPWILLW